MWLYIRIKPITHIVVHPFEKVTRTARDGDVVVGGVWGNGWATLGSIRLATSVRISITHKDLIKCNSLHIYNTYAVHDRLKRILCRRIVDNIFDCWDIGTSNENGRFSRLGQTGKCARLLVSRVCHCNFRETN